MSAGNWVLRKRQVTLWQRARIIQAIRLFFIDLGYLEVETPHRIPAPAPESYIDAVPSGSWFLHTSPELCMKRLLAAGYEKIFQICRCWREGERGSGHVPEFTLLEWYRAHSHYRMVMEECEALIRSVAARIGLGPALKTRGLEIDLAGPWQRMTVNEAFCSHAIISMKEALKRDLFDEVMAQDIEPNLGIGKPTFLCDYPAERAALARLKEDDPTLAERFELYIGGVEVANAFSELTNWKEQRKRFVVEEAYRRSMGKAPYPMPEKFLKELDQMPPSAGVALGVDRLVMVLLDRPAIDNVITFLPEEL